MNDPGYGILLNHTLSMSGVGNGGCVPIMQWVPVGGCGQSFIFLGLGAPACPLDLGVCRFDALAVDVGGFKD